MLTAVVIRFVLRTSSTELRGIREKIRRKPVISQDGMCTWLKNAFMMHSQCTSRWISTILPGERHPHFPHRKQKQPEFDLKVKMSDKAFGDQGEVYNIYISCLSCPLSTLFWISREFHCKVSKFLHKGKPALFLHFYINIFYFTNGQTKTKNPPCICYLSATCANRYKTSMHCVL